MLDSLLSALGYVGDSLAKPGRAVRGLLAGRPDEALAALPFSDTLGLTDPSQAVTGHDLLRNFGMDPGDGIGGTLAGIGVDMATDPLTYAGGALGRGLLGGKYGRRVANESDIFDLVNPAEREADAARAAMVDRAFPVPSAAPPRDAGGLMENLSAGGQGPVADQLPMGPLTHLPNPEGYRPLMGVDEFGAHSPEFAGYAGDALMDHGPLSREAFQVSLGSWDQVLKDLQRVDPEAMFKEGLGSVGAGSRTERAADWMRHLENRAGDLRAVGHHAGSAADPALAEAARKQLQEIHALGLGVSPHSPANYGLQDILGGLTKPSDVPEMLREGGPLSHLPLDPRELRKMAASTQRETAINEIRQMLEHLTDGNEIPLADLAHGYEMPYPADSLRRVLSPDRIISDSGIEPGVAAGLIRNPPPGPDGDMIRQAIEAYNQMLAHPYFADKSRLYPRIR